MADGAWFEDPTLLEGLTGASQLGVPSSQLPQLPANYDPTGMSGVSGAGGSGMNWGQLGPGLKQAAAAAKTPDQAPHYAPAPAALTPGQPRAPERLSDLVALLQKRNMGLLPAYGSGGQPPAPIRSTGGLLGF
jgi:hypothetical protein